MIYHLKKFLKSLPERYWFFACWHLNTWVFNYGYSRELDNLLKELATNRIMKLTTDYSIDILFDDGSTAHLWNGNKYYAWLSSGSITMIDGRSHNYFNNRPRATTMVKILRMIKSYKPKPVKMTVQNSLEKIDKLYDRVCSSNDNSKEDIYYIGYCKGILTISNYLSDKNKKKLNELWKKYSM